MRIALGPIYRMLEKRHDLEFPKTIPIDTVSFCNLQCTMCCHREMKRPKGRMKWSLFKKIIDEIAVEAPHTRVLLAFFGEPLLLRRTLSERDDLRSIDSLVAHAKQAGCMDVAINTNGVLLDSEIATRLLDAGLDRMYVGIDATTPETYQEIRVGGNFETVVRNVLEFLDLMNDRHAGARCAVQVQFIEMDENEHELEEFSTFWKDKGVSVKIRRKVTWTGLVEPRKRPQKVTEVQRHLCYWAMNTMAITHVGDVTMCPADPEARFVAGNVTNQSLKSIWQGPMRGLREVHRKEKWNELPFPCDQCDDWFVSFGDTLDLPIKPAEIARTIRLAVRKFRRN